MDSGAAESSNPWNNAGTGHAGLCELNYTPQAADGTVDIKKAVHINTQFEVSKQFWSYLTKKGTFGSCKSFISPVPHLSFVQGESGVSFLKERFKVLSKHHAFASMEYTEDKAKMAEWMPLMMPGRPWRNPRRHPRDQWHRRQLRRPDQPVAQAPDQRTRCPGQVLQACDRPEAQ
jgi:malate dehydrogenase (quinone)